jgi:transcriptional regulator with XRE-family HTH domain
VETKKNVDIREKMDIEEEEIAVEKTVNVKRTIIQSQLQILRNKLGLTQVKMAEALGISRSYYCNLESGEKDVTKEIALRLLAVFRSEHSARILRELMVHDYKDPENMKVIEKLIEDTQELRKEKFEKFRMDMMFRNNLAPFAAPYSKALEHILTDLEYEVDFIHHYIMNPDNTFSDKQEKQAHMLLTGQDGVPIRLNHDEYEGLYAQIAQRYSELMQTVQDYIAEKRSEQVLEDDPDEDDDE